MVIFVLGVECVCVKVDLYCVDGEIIVDMR